MKTIFQKVKSSLTLQKSGIIDKRIKELEEISNDFISKAYDVDQEKTIEFLKVARIGGYSIIGEFWNGAMQHVELQIQWRSTHAPSQIDQFRFIKLLIRMSDVNLGATQSKKKWRQLIFELIS